MLCILIFLAGMLFFINNKIVHFQTRMEMRISELEKRQNSIEQSLGFLRNIPPGIESLQKHGEALKEKMEVIQEALEKFIDELSESFSTEQKEKVKKALNEFFRLWEAFGEFLEKLEAENREIKEGGQGEGSKN
jgi:polyhydroxyalkanoate synthesis regulator protein